MYTGVIAVLTPIRLVRLKILIDNSYPNQPSIYTNNRVMKANNVI